MTVEAITVFRAGAFTTEPAPDWLQRVKAVAEGETHDRYRAIGKVLGDDGSVTEIQDHGGVAVQVNEWPTAGDGRYVEFSDVLRVIAEVWIPEPAGWIPFYSGHIIPFLRTHAEMATAGQLDRIGNCLIALARHGEGQHIKRDCGRSQIDINHDRDFMRRASRASAGPGSPDAPTNERLLRLPLLARSQPRTAPSDEDLLAMRRAAWRSQDVVALRPEKDVRDDWTRQAVINETNRLHGQRPGDRP